MTDQDRAALEATHAPVTIADDTRKVNGIMIGQRVVRDVFGAMYRCGRCKAVRRVDYQGAKVTRYFERRSGFDSVQGKDWWLVLDLPDGTQASYPPDLPCGCGWIMRARLINGKYNADIPCTARCVAAKGHDCECSCGGRNHGRDHC